MTFLDTIEALGLEQLVKEQMHRSENILDLVTVEPSERINIIYCVVKNYFSHHKSVMCAFNHIGYDALQVKEMSFRKLKDINPEEFTSDLNFNMGIEDDLDVLIEKFEDGLCMVLDKHAPIKTKKITERKKRAWFNDEVKEAKQKVGRREKIWKQYKHHQ